MVGPTDGYWEVSSILVIQNLNFLVSEVTSFEIKFETFGRRILIQRFAPGGLSLDPKPSQWLYGRIIQCLRSFLSLESLIKRSNDSVLSGDEETIMPAAT